MKHGVVLGKHLDISRAEIFAQGIEIEKHYWQVAIFSDIKNIDFVKLAGIVKRGQVIETKDITSTDLIGVSSAELGNFFKKKGLCRRYKDFDPMHTDEEIKNKRESDKNNPRFQMKRSNNEKKDIKNLAKAKNDKLLNIVSWL